MNFLENLRNRLCYCNPRRLRAQQVAETARDMAMNVVNRVNDNPQQEENLAPVRYEHIVGHLGANINTRPQPVAEELHEEQPVNQPAAQRGEDGLPVLRRANQPANQPVNQQENLPASNIIYYDGRQKLVRRSNDAEIALYGNGKHHRTGSIDVTSGYGAEVRAYYADYSSYINMQNGGRIHRSNSITVEPGTKAEMTSSDGSTQTSIEFENKTRIHKDGSFDF